MTEIDWKERIHSVYFGFLQNKQSKADFLTWKEFYYYLHDLSWSRASLIEAYTHEYTWLDVDSIKESIHFLELEIFFHHPACYTIRQLKKGDAIKFKDNQYYLIIYEDYLRCEQSSSELPFGIRNPRLHNWTPIYEFPITYWSSTLLDQRLNLFALYLHSDAVLKIIPDSSFLLASILIYKNVRYMVLFQNKISRDNFSNSRMCIRCRPLFNLSPKHTRIDLWKLLETHNISKYRTLVEIKQH